MLQIVNAVSEHLTYKRLIRSLRSLEFKPGMSVPDPSSDHGHMCDALGYAALALSKGLTPWKLGRGPSFW